MLNEKEFTKQETKTPVQQKIDFSSIKESSYGAVTADGEVVKSINDIKPGQKFGKLTIIKELPKIDSKRRWLTYCDCGNTYVAFGYQLLSNGVKSCGCDTPKRSEAISLVKVGDRFGRLVVTGFAGRAKEGQHLVVCKCDCGTVKKYRVYSLLSGNTRSCGCLQRDMSIIRGLHSDLTANDIISWTPEQIQEFCARYEEKKQNKSEVPAVEESQSVQTLPTKRNRRSKTNHKIIDLQYQIKRANSANKKEVQNLSSKVNNLEENIIQLLEMDKNKSEQVQSLFDDVINLNLMMSKYINHKEPQGFWSKLRSCLSKWFS